jgi:hypothetical protein
MTMTITDTEAQTIQDVEYFTADHSFLVMDMIAKGYTRTAHVGLPYVTAEKQKAVFWSEELQSDIILVNTQFIVNGQPVQGSDINPAY